MTIYITSLPNQFVDIHSPDCLSEHDIVSGTLKIVEDSVLDLTLTTNPDLISDLEIQPGMSDHCAVTYTVNLAVKRQKKPDRYVYQYRKGDLEGVKRDLGEFKEMFLSNGRLGDLSTTTGISARMLFPLP